MAVIRRYCEKGFAHIVGLRSQTERTSASSVEKACYYTHLQVYTMHIWIFFSWQILKPRTAIHKVVECLANNEFFVHLHRKLLPERSSDSETGLEASFDEEEVLKYYFNRGFN